MKLGTKIIAATIGSIAISVVVGLVVQRKVIREQGIEMTRDTMRAAVLEAETVRESIAGLNERGAFDRSNLMAEYKQSHNLRGSTLYGTIPVVAAWKAIEKVAEQEGYEFRVPKQQARNPNNNPTPEEGEILRSLESGRLAEYFKVDHRRNEIVFARPIVLTTDCLLCHGDPKNSPTGDGRDLLGFEMENWQAGEVHGAFVLKAKLNRVDALVRAGFGTTLLWVVPLSGLIGIGFLFLNRAIIVRPLNASIACIDEASWQTAAASDRVSVSSQSLAEGASEQAGSLEETSASLEEMSAMTRRNADNAGKAKSLTNQTRAAADTGVKDVAQMTDAMDQIKGAGDNISKIIKTIDEIAFQTNILALNAAVEAARAGEAGMGFAVVADEVRNLAQRSAEAARETAAKIEDSIQKSEQGVTISNKVAVSLREILTKACAVDELVNEIASACQEQSLGIQQINSSVIKMDKVTQNNAASAEESANAALQLSEQAGALNQAVLALRSLVGQQAPSPAVPPAPQTLIREDPEQAEPARPEHRRPQLPAAAPASARAIASFNDPVGERAQFADF